jgi:hypothetical protein
MVYQQGGGLFHVAMGAVLGVSAYGRTQEKVAGASNVSTNVPTPELSSATPTPSSFGGGFNSTPAPTPTSWGTTPISADANLADNSFGSTPTKPIVRRPV